VTMQYIDVFTQRLFENIMQDYFDIILVTSRSLGRVKGSRRPYRVGKSTFAMWLSFITHKLYYEYYGKNYSDEELWDMVFDRLFYSIYDMDKYIRGLAEKKQQVPAVILDDAERTAPALQRIPPRLRRTIDNINVYGTQVKFLIMTAPAMKSIAKPLREMVTFEVIIPFRGYFEVQEIVLEKDFYNAPREIGRYIYRSEGHFPPLPEEIQRRYDEWRKSLPAQTGDRQDHDGEGLDEAEARKILRSLKKYYEATRRFIVNKDGKIYLRLDGVKIPLEISQRHLRKLDEFFQELMIQ